jgi:hypothetical protein
MRHFVLLCTTALAMALSSSALTAGSYPIIAFGTRTYVAETTESGGTVLVRVYRRTNRTSWHRYGGFTVPAKLFAARRAKVKSNPQAASAAERVYFTGKVIGMTPFQPSSAMKVRTPVSRSGVIGIVSAKTACPQRSGQTRWTRCWRRRRTFRRNASACCSVRTRESCTSSTEGEAIATTTTLQTARRPLPMLVTSPRARGVPRPMRPTGGP